jgi:hypothetical protein
VPSPATSSSLRSVDPLRAGRRSSKSPISSGRRLQPVTP